MAVSVEKFDNKRIHKSIRDTFELELCEGKSKVISLREAIRKNVRPGKKIFIGWNANAIVCELIRQYWGKKPKFTIIMTVTWDHSLNLIHCGLAKKLITTSCSYLFPTPSPSHVIQKAYSEGKVAIENWSLYSIQQRLMAGALGVGFMPTKSIVKSSMADENCDSFTEIENPFEARRKIGVLRALNPGISLIHGLAADHYGNTILSPISQDTAWGARASLEGVVVTVEKIVSTDFIRHNSALVSIPGYLVNSVSVCPFGAHPQGLYSNLDEVQGYREDYDFMFGQRRASQEPSMLDAWIKEWVFNLKGQSDYLRKLGSKRISFLKERASVDSWKHELKPVSNLVLTRKEYNPTEMMIVAASRKIVEIVKSLGYKVLLAGIGACGLGAWLAFYKLKKKGYNVELALGSGMLGYVPRPSDPLVISVLNAGTAKMLTDASNMYGFIICGKNSKCLSVLGASQIDKYGNLNTTKVSRDMYLIGSGGSNDNASGASEVLAVVPQSEKRCVEKIDYITCPGKKVKTLITTMGVFEKGGGEVFMLTGYFHNPRLHSPETLIEKVSENCGWELRFSKDMKKIPPPNEDELLTLRLLDPHGYLLKP